MFVLASAECKRRGVEDNPAHRREVLGSVMYDIRFPAMNVQDFADHAATSGNLAVFKYFTIDSY